MYNEITLKEHGKALFHYDSLRVLFQFRASAGRPEMPEILIRQQIERLFERARENDLGKHDEDYEDFEIDVGKIFLTPDASYTKWEAFCNVVMFGRNVEHIVKLFNEDQGDVCEKKDEDCEIISVTFLASDSVRQKALDAAQKTAFKNLNERIQALKQCDPQLNYLLSHGMRTLNVISDIEVFHKGAFSSVNLEQFSIKNSGVGFATVQLELEVRKAGR